MTTATGHTSAIRAKKVIGTSVKNTAGEKIGQVEDIVLDKTSNSIVFAVVGFGAPSDTWTAIAGSTLWCKLFADFALSRHAHAAAARARA